MIYSRLSRFYFIFLFVSICFGCCSKITNAGMHGKVATIEDIGKMLDEFKSYYKGSFFSEDKKIRDYSWSYKNRGRHVYGQLDGDDIEFLIGCKGKSYGDLFGDESLKPFSNRVIEGKEFMCQHVAVWCLRYLESKNFICGLLFPHLYSNRTKLSGFHWCVVVPVLDSFGNLDMYVCELHRYNPNGYTREKILFHWRSFFSSVSWVNFVIVKNDEIYNHIPRCIRDDCSNDGPGKFTCKCSAVSAPIWVWNIMKHLSERATHELKLSARGWMLKETRRIVDCLNEGKIDYKFWPYIVPFGRKEKFNSDEETDFDVKMVGKCSGGILQVPSIADANFNVRCLPEWRWAKWYNLDPDVKEEMGLDESGRDWAITSFYLLRDSRFDLKGIVTKRLRDGKIDELPDSLKTNKEISPKEFFDVKNSNVYFELLAPQIELHRPKSAKRFKVRPTIVEPVEPKKIMCRSKSYKKRYNVKPKRIIRRSESARRYYVKFIDDCYSIKPDPYRENKGKFFTLLLELFEYFPYDLFGYQ